MKKFLSHAIFFLLGLLGTGVYHHWFVNPKQVAWLQEICNEADLGYPGDWVLDIFFPVIPLVFVFSVVWLVLHLRSK